MPTFLLHLHVGYARFAEPPRHFGAPAPEQQRRTAGSARQLAALAGGRRHFDAVLAARASAREPPRYRHFNTISRWLGFSYRSTSPVGLL